MYKLVVVAGPMRGAQYTVKTGETSIGRNNDNDIVLTSQKVSKKHCVLVVNNQEVSVKDNGSSNGTFVNGALAKFKKLLPGDRVSVGEFVLELIQAEKTRSANNNQSSIQLTNSQQPSLQLVINNTSLVNAASAASKAEPPAKQNIKDRVIELFEKYVINFVYNLNEKHEWQILMAAMFVVVVVGSALLSVYPVLNRVSEKLAQEAESRAFMLARQAVDRNAPLLFERLESKTDVSYIEKEPGVVAAYLVDMDGRIIAPARKLNQSIADTQQAAFSSRARAAYTQHESLERKATVFNNIVGVAVPLKIFSPSQAKNITVALGIVFFDRSQITIDSGTESLAYIQAIILCSILGVMVFFALYRLTLRPLTTLNTDIDLVLKGNAHSVQAKFKMQEINPLIDIINTTLQRATSHGSGASNDHESSAQRYEELLQSVRLGFAKSIDTGALVLSAEKNIVFISPFFEEISGIRHEAAVGQAVASVARDAAFQSFIEDITSKAQVGSHDGYSEDFEFSGNNFKMVAQAVGSLTQVQYYIVYAHKG